MNYNNDKDVVFSFMQRVDFNQTWQEIEFGLGYDFGDYNFGKGDTAGLRRKIKETIKFMKIQFDGVFDDNHCTVAKS